MKPIMAPTPWRWGTVINAVRPDVLTTAERLGEVADILAAGLIRLRVRQSTPLPRNSEESSLDCPGHQSGYADILKDGDSD